MTDSIYILSPSGCQIDFLLDGLRQLLPVPFFDTTDLGELHDGSSEPGMHDVVYDSKQARLDFSLLAYQLAPQPMCGRSKFLHIYSQDAVQLLLNRIGAKATELQEDQLTQELKNITLDTAQARQFVADHDGFEITFEQLVRGDLSLSQLAIHQIGGYLNVDCSTIKPNTSSLQPCEEHQRIRRQMRPMLLRNGFESLIETPRAA